MSNKKNAIICCLALMTVPLLLGAKDVTDENTVAESVNVSEDTVDEPFKDTSPKDSDSDLDSEDSDSTSEGENRDKPINIPVSPTDYNYDYQVDNMFREYVQKFEGRTIVAINFEGASDVNLSTVKAAIISKVGDTFDTNAAIRDRNAIRNIGYFYDAYQTFEEIPEGVIITYHMLENPVLKDIVISGNTVIETGELQKLMTVKRNEILNSNTLHDNLAAVQEKYRGDGYILMKITDINVNQDGILSLKINEGVLEGYKISGNKKTKDYVITREMRQKAGEVFNAKMARRSMERVYNLGFFEDVNVKMLPGVEPNAVVMEVEVKEKRTGTFGIGAGYNTQDGLVGMITISDRNFRGAGEAVSLTYEKGSGDYNAHGIAFTYRKPWLDSHETAGTFRFYNRTYQYYDYDTDGELKERYMRKYTGGEVTLSRPVSEYSTNYVTLKQRRDSYVRHISAGRYGNRSGEWGADWRSKNFGLTRSIELQHITDTRDNVFNPSTGGKVTLGAEFGGWLGGDFTFQKYNIEHEQFYRAGDHSQVWAARVSYGLGNGDLTEFNQFRVGGQNSLRGYRDDQFRGNRMTLGTLEYRFPLAKKVQGILFTDWGGAWNNGFFPESDDIFGSVGTGIALNTPLGPLRLDYGHGEQGGRFHFSVGGGF